MAHFENLEAQVRVMLDHDAFSLTFVSNNGFDKDDPEVWTFEFTIRGEHEDRVEAALEGASRDADGVHLTLYMEDYLERMQEKVLYDTLEEFREHRDVVIAEVQRELWVEIATRVINEFPEYRNDFNPEGLANTNEEFQTELQYLVDYTVHFQKLAVAVGRGVVARSVKLKY